MFIRELVPMRLVAWVARVMFREPFAAAKVSSHAILHGTAIEVHRTIQTQRRAQLPLDAVIVLIAPLLIQGLPCACWPEYVYWQILCSIVWIQIWPYEKI